MPEVESVSDVRDNWNPTQYGRLCSLLTVYRLLDTLAFVAGVSQRAACLNRSSESSLLVSLPVSLRFISRYAIVASYSLMTGFGMSLGLDLDSPSIARLGPRNIRR